jgi:hypothetical protein
MTINSLPSERWAVAATIDPDAYAYGTFTSDYVDMENFDALLAVLMVGTITAAGGTVTAKLVQATTSGGAGSKDISGKALTELVGADDDVQALINLRAEELDVDNDFQFVAIEVLLADSASPDVGTVDLSAVLFGIDGRYLPASDLDLASVDEIVN